MIAREDREMYVRCVCKQRGNRVTLMQVAFTPGSVLRLLSHLSCCHSLHACRRRQQTRSHVGGVLLPVSCHICTLSHRISCHHPKGTAPWFIYLNWLFILHLDCIRFVIILYTPWPLPPT